MAKNTGKPTEQAFEDLFKPAGKRAFLHRLTDASDVFGLTDKAANQAAQPSDYVVVHDGETFFAEVKSTQNATSFPFSLLKSGQSAAGLQIEGAGGHYLVFVRALALPGQPWFRVHYSTIRAAKADGKGSLKWKDMQCWM
jgi:penicillin-binding protein-related factor A (putative recombinase)